MRLPEEYASRMRAQLKEEYPAYLNALAEPPRRGLRVNTLKIGVSEFLGLSPWPLAPPLVTEGFLLPDDAAPVGRHPLHRAGLN